jgi:hypothetical protein
MKRITTTLIAGIALVMMPFGLASADCGQDHGAKATQTSAETAGMSHGHMQNPGMMMQNMNDHYSMMIMRLDTLEQRVDQMMQMQDMQKLHQSLMNYKSMLGDFRKQMIEGQQMQERAAEMLASGEGEQEQEDR